jgi:type II secretory pathway pseudopilin PulG
MAALLVALSVMAVLATAAMPVWHQMTQREKEEELVFRGNQYVRAIRLFTAKAGPGVLPPNLDVLVQQRFLRKKYKDPVTGQEFDLLSPVQATVTPGALAGSSAAAPTAGRGGPGQQPQSTGNGAVVAPQPAGGRGAGPGGIMGVASKSKAESIRLYNGRSHYNEWQFLYVAQVQQAGGGGRGQRGRGQGPGQPPGVGVPGRGIGGRQGQPAPGAPGPFVPGGRQTFPNPGGQPTTPPGFPRPVQR